VQRDWLWHNNTWQLDVQGRFDLLGWQHQILIGADHENYRNSSQQWISPRSVGYGINVWHPVYDKPIPEFKQYTYSLNQEKSRAIHFQDQIHLTERLLTTVGARYERITVFGKNRLNDAVTSDHARTAFVPRAALLYKLTPQVNLFTSASRSFKPNGVAASTGAAYAPEKGVGYEMGAKFDWFEGRFGATVAAFHITKQNVLTAHPDPDVTDRITVGEQRSQGIDLQASGSISPALRLIGAYAYIHAKVTKDNNTPNTTGNRLAGVPWHSASLLAVYRLEPMELGGSVTYVGARRGSNSSTFEAPSYRTVDLFTRWQAGERLHMTLNWGNVFNTRYYPQGGSSVSMPGEPRNIKLTVALEL